MNVHNLTISSFQSYHRVKDLKLYRLTMWNFKEFGFKDLLITYPNDVQIPSTNLIIFLHDRKLIWKCVKKLKRIS